MNENQISIEQVLALLGSKEVELSVLRGQLQQALQEIKRLKPDEEKEDVWKEAKVK